MIERIQRPLYNSYVLYYTYLGVYTQTAFITVEVKILLPLTVGSCIPTCKNLKMATFEAVSIFEYIEKFSTLSFVFIQISYILVVGG